MYDVAIIGLGTAGYTAAIYCARYKLSLFLVGAVDGGTGLAAAEVGDWPGDISTTGPELMERQKKHALSFDSVTYRNARVERVEHVGGKESKEGASFRLTLEGGATVEAKTIIFATGSINRKLGVPGEMEFAGKGVTYCATCDAYFFRGKDVAVVGGGDSAVEGAAIAAQVCKTVYLIHRRKEFRAEPYWVDRVKARENIVFVLERTVVDILGDTKVTGVRLDKPWTGREGQEGKEGVRDVLAVEGVFIEIGADPATELPQQLGCELDERKHVRVDAGLRTNVPGAFAAGDVSSGSNHFAQFVTAAGEGAIAAKSVFEYLSKGK
jgi:thioredoxin reductase (NADPH)